MTDPSTEPDVKLLGDVHRPGLVRQPDEFPFHVGDEAAMCERRMRQTKVDNMCSPHGRLFWQCEYRNFVMRVECASAVGPLLIDRNRSFPQRLQIMGWDAPEPADFKREPRVFDELAIVDTCFSGAWGHFAKDLLPRLFVVLKYVPPHVPILLPDHDTARKWLTYLVRVGVVNVSRVNFYGGDYAPFARVAWSPGELARSARTDGWRSNSGHCGWRHGLPGLLIRELIYGNAQPGRLRRITVIDRRAGPKNVARVLTNQVELNAALQSHFPDFEILFFRGSDATVDESIAFFNRTALLVGAHGAGLAYMAWLPPSGAVLEIGYTGDDGFVFPDGDFPSYGLGLGLDYSVSYARGSHNGPLLANISDIVALARGALVRIGFELI